MCFALTSSPLFLRISCFRHVPVCFACPVFYSSLRFFCGLSRFLSRVVVFLFFGGEVWPGAYVFGPALGSVDSSLGSGKICASGFAWTVSCSASFFFSACGSDRTLEFLHCEEVSGGPQVVLFLGLSTGAAASCIFHNGAFGLLGEVFYSFFFPRLRVPFYGLF